MEEPSHRGNIGQTLDREVFVDAKLLPAKSPCRLSPRAPCFAPQAEEQRTRMGLPIVEKELIQPAFGIGSFPRIQGSWERFKKQCSRTRRGRKKLRLIRFPPLPRRNEVVIRETFPESRWALRFFRWTCRCRASVRRYGQSDQSECPSGSGHGTIWFSASRSGSGGNRTNRSLFFLPGGAGKENGLGLRREGCNLRASSV